MKVLLILNVFFLLSACGLDELSQKQRLENTSDDVISEAPEDLKLVIDDSKIQKGTYNAMGVSSADVPAVTARGEWCVGKSHMNEFRCGFGDPGVGWVKQTDGCYHLQTNRTCSCSVGADWYNDATYECKGNVLYIVDACGDEKFVANHSDCLDQSDGSIDTLNREKVKKAYKEIYLKPSPDRNWTGNVNDCKAGKNSLAFQERVMEQINFYRAMSGIPLAKIVPDMSKYQEAALIMDANYSLSHYPEESWKCYSAEGKSGASSSNLALGASGTRAIDLYINDPGANNGAVGHRRWLLHPQKLNFATGDTPRANSIGVFLSGSQSFSGEKVAWPNSGYFPYQLLPSSNRWSLSFPRASFTNTTVQMKNKTTGESYNVTLEPVRSNYGYDTIVFKPSGLSRSRPSKDQNIEVKVINVKIGTVEKTFTYIVKIIDPNT